MKYCKHKAVTSRERKIRFVSASYYFADQRSVGGRVKLKYNQWTLTRHETR
jgi:hypothetical protein